MGDASTWLIMMRRLVAACSMEKIARSAGG
jgi:hypothetical protein